MKASDLIGQRVIDADGAELGVVTDLRCIQDGPLRGSMAAPRLSELIVSRHRAGSLLGYDRSEQQGPWLVRIIVRRLHRPLIFISWDDVQVGADAIAVTVAGASLQR
jgi:sporulation protein YlmC with PRC-barrel domain